MAHMKTRSRIVVGVNGSAASVAAMHWAVQEARLRGAAVHLVWACEKDAGLRAPYAPRSQVTREDESRAAGAMLTAIAELARPHLPPGRLTVELAHEPPVRALLDRAAAAEMLVLGTTRLAGEPGQSPGALGPVARACLRLARCPVVVVTSGDETPGQERREPASAAR